MADTAYQFASALIDGDWVTDPVISVDHSGVISAIHDVTSFDGRPEHRFAFVALPGMVNVHSHAFQYGFAGLSEYRTARHDSFWTWRKLMYEFVEQRTPDDVYDTAKGLYAQLLRNGYTWVGEFHYLHNQPNGTPYENPACLSDAMIQAAVDTGIGICLLPVLYQRGGFGQAPAGPVQQRFSLSEDTFIDLVTDLQNRFAQTPNVEVGYAFHSLRAVEMSVIQRVVDALKSRRGPIHVHVAEQTAEVEACVQHTGRRPVEYLLSEADVDDQWCLVHATHMNELETSAVASSGATAGLCPTTEANLGDGLFPARAFLEGGGRIAIGSDSHVSTSPRSELRLLEYGQRLVRRERAVLGTTEHSVGRRLYEGASNGGAAALGIPAGSIRVGQRADLVLIDPRHSAIRNAGEDRLLDRYVFCDDGNPVSAVMVGGKIVHRA